MLGGSLTRTWGLYTAPPRLRVLRPRLCPSTSSPWLAPYMGRGAEARLSLGITGSGPLFMLMMPLPMLPMPATGALGADPMPAQRRMTCFPAKPSATCRTTLQLACS